MANTSKKATTKKTEVKKAQTKSAKNAEKKEVASKTVTTKKNIDKLHFVADEIKYNRDLKPYKAIEIVAGVGAGKNYFIKELAKKHTVLEVTSRRKTADAQAAYLAAEKSLTTLKKDRGEKAKETNIDYIRDCVEGGVSEGKKDIVITYYQLSLYAKYGPGSYEIQGDAGKIRKQYDWLWDMFDFIVFDEYHSLTADASYQEAPFYVEYFLKRCLGPDTKSRVILMTATPEPTIRITNIVRKIVGEEKFNYLNMYDSCYHVETKNVVMHPYEDIIQKLNIDIYGLNNKIIYFTQTIEQMKDVYNLLSEIGLPDCAIAVDFANDPAGKNIEKAKTYFSDTVMKNRDRTRESLMPIFGDDGNQTGGEVIPNDIYAFLTTEVNREGINIKNDDIKTVYINSCSKCDITQILGRLRKGVEWAHIVYNYQENPNEERIVGFRKNIDEENIFNVNIWGAAQGWWPNSGDYKIVKYVNDSFENIKYNQFEQAFELYMARYLDYELRKKEKNELYEIRDNWEIKNKTYNEELNATLGKSKKKIYMYIDELDMINRVIPITTRIVSGYNRDNYLYGENDHNEETFEACFQIMLGKEKKKAKKEPKLNALEIRPKLQSEMTGADFFKQAWFPYSNVYLDKDLYVYAAADNVRLREKVADLIDPLLGKRMKRGATAETVDEIPDKDATLLSDEERIYNNLQEIFKQSGIRTIETLRKEKYLPPHFSVSRSLKAILDCFGYEMKETHRKVTDATFVINKK